MLVDELGRGTSNKEGSSIAWGVAEALLSANSFTLFVTHYPLLLSLSPLYPNVRNVHLAIDTSATAGGASSSKFKYRHIVEEGPSALESDYGIDMAERVRTKIRKYENNGVYTYSRIHGCT